MEGKVSAEVEAVQKRQKLRDGVAEELQRSSDSCDIGGDCGARWRDRWQRDRGRPRELARTQGAARFFRKDATTRSHLACLWFREWKGNADMAWQSLSEAVTAAASTARRNRAASP